MTAAIVLAAGLGTRFGGGKMLAPIDGRPMLQHVLDLVAEAGLEPVVVVVGSDAAKVETSLAWRNEMRVRNPQPERGISSSLQVALKVLLGTDATRTLVLLGDQPFLAIDQINVLGNAPSDPARPIVVPRYDGRPGNPVLLEREVWHRASQLGGDRGMSQLFAVNPELVRYVDFSGRNPDVDTPADLAALNPS